MNKKTTKQTHRMHRVCMLLAIFTLLFCCGGCGKKTPREALEAAYEKTFIENNPVESLLGLSELSSRQTNQEAYSSGMSLTLQKLSGEGLEQFADVVEMLFDGETPCDGSILTNARQFDAIRRAYDALQRSLKGLRLGLTPDMVLIDVEEAMEAMGEVTGNTVREDITARIFERFCVGK